MSGTEPPTGGPDPLPNPRVPNPALRRRPGVRSRPESPPPSWSRWCSRVYVGGVGPFAKSHAPPSGPETFSQAEAVGASVVGAYDGGGWSLIAAASAVVRQSEVVPLLAVETALRRDLGSCALQWLTSASSFEVPGFSGNPEAGLSPFWALVYRNASVSGSGLLFVTVSNGTAQLTALLPGERAGARPTARSLRSSPRSRARWSIPLRSFRRRSRRGAVPSSRPTPPRT